MPEPKLTNADIDAFGDKRVNLPSADAKAGRERVNWLREQLEKHISANPGFSLIKMLHAGSVAKGTALSKVNDLDVAVYVKVDDSPTDDNELVDWMAERLRQVYGKRIAHDQIKPGVRCVTITFANGLSVDVVPVLYEGDDNDCGYLVSRDGERLLTSVRLHLDFIRARKNAHPQDFAQVVRYFKWWIRQRKTEDASFKFKSFMAELIVAHLADTGAIDPTDHIGALTGVFEYIVDSKLDKRIAFTDYYPASKLPGPTDTAIEVFDPVNPANDIAHLYTDADRRRIVEAADDALSAITEAAFATTKTQAVECWQIVLGTQFKG